MEDAKTEMIKLADRADSEERFMNAAFYYRVAEFCVPWIDPNKAVLYERFIEYFYLVVGDDDFTIAVIPLGSTVVPTTIMEPEEGATKITVILHSGYDGFTEELYSIMCFFGARF